MFASLCDEAPRPAPSAAALRLQARIARGPVPLAEADPDALANATHRGVVRLILGLGGTPLVIRSRRP